MPKKRNRGGQPRVDDVAGHYGPVSNEDRRNSPVINQSGHYGPASNEERRNSPLVKQSGHYGPARASQQANENPVAIPPESSGSSKSGQAPRPPPHQKLPSYVMLNVPIPLKPIPLRPILPGHETFPPRPPPMPYPPGPMYPPQMPMNFFMQPRPPLQTPTKPQSLPQILSQGRNTRRPCFRLATTLAISRAACASASEFIQLKSAQGLHDEEDEELFLGDEPDMKLYEDISDPKQINKKNSLDQNDHDDLYGGLDIYEDMAPVADESEDDLQAKNDDQDGGNFHSAQDDTAGGADGLDAQFDDTASLTFDQATTQQPIVQALTRLENELIRPYLPPPPPSTNLISQILTTIPSH
uniref:Uncharacterized protein n=1 Tax=Aureoumbra lagunensis TaxID=44058 RepID=A0A7S3NMT9_9STRA|mmetsp:Transcript_19183/g.24889  ORF Transcript_19183/g.24889 Transcript_19183/m.24889 type:complete len:355 (+) Transcript_19183:13-1077(+)